MLTTAYAFDADRQIRAPVDRLDDPPRAIDGQTFSSSRAP